MSITKTVALSWEGFEIYWYGLILAVSLILGYLVLRKLYLRQGLGIGLVDKFFVQIVIWGFIGARLYHVINEAQYYLSEPGKIFFIWEGGLAIHGAIIAGLIYTIFFSRKFKISFWKLADIASIPLLLGQALGRWGNYFNEELFGRPSNLPWAIYISPDNRPLEYMEFARFHPAFLYEFFWDFAGFLILLRYYRSVTTKKAPDGRIFALYLIIYSLGRIGVEFLRVDRVPIILGFRLPLVMSLILLISGVFLLVRRWRGERDLNPRPSA